MARGNNGVLFFIVYLILGLYFLNFGLNFIKVPDFVIKISNWIIFVGGALLIFDAIKFLMVRKTGPR